MSDFASSDAPPAVDNETEALRQERDRFRALVDLTAEGFSIFDAHANILYESPANTRIHGYAQAEMEGRNLFDFTHPDDRTRVSPHFALLAASPGNRATDTVRFRHKLGHWVYLEGTVVNLLDDPRIQGLINNFRDVTARVEAERELKRAKESAEQAQRLQQHFLTNLSHEFRTPLTLIHQPIRDLRAACTRLSHNPLWDIVEGNLQRLDGLFSELIDLSLLDAGTFELRARLGNMAAFLRDQLACFALTAAARGITLRPVIRPVPPLYFDASKLAKVISNLLSNALKFTPVGGRVTVSLAAEPADGEPFPGRVRCAVADTGPGIPSGEIPRVFERFYQVAQGDTRPAEGMGIGLALAREMVAMHGGEIGVESEPGQGSHFWFWLPLGHAHLHPDDLDLSAPPEPVCFTAPPLAFPGSEPATAQAEADKPALLLVEDNADLRYYLGLHLREHYRVTGVADGAEALARIARDRPALVLSDVMMPRLDGLTLCQRLRADPATASLPVVLLSAKGSHEDRTAGLAAGASDYVSKPFAMPELLLRLRRLSPAAAPETPEPGTLTRWKNRFAETVRHEMPSPDFSVAKLAVLLGMSERQLQRRCLEVFDQSPCEVIRIARVRRARELLRNGEFATVAETAYAVGMTPSYLTRLFRSQLGLAPKELLNA